jgi:hypothetical protein
MNETRRRLAWLDVMGLLAFLFCTLAGDVALAQETRPRVIVSTDIGGTDDDDFQSLAHLLLYADVMDLEGLISSPYGSGRKKHILEVIDAYSQDYPTLKTHSASYPSPDYLRSVTREGATEIADDAGFGATTEGSELIIRSARRADPRPLWVLVWGGIEDLAQALHDAPDILPKLRVYWIGGPNKKWSPSAYNYIERHHPKLWIIEANSTYSGWFVGGDQSGEWGNKSFIASHVAGHGALGGYLAKWIGGEMKMGDTPSVMYVLGERPEDPTRPSWGGSFVRAWPRPRAVFGRITTAVDQVEQYAIVDIELPPGHGVNRSHRAHLAIENQMLPGFVDPDTGVLRFRLSPKAARQWTYTIHSDIKGIDGKTGALTSTFGPIPPDAPPWSRTPNWWTDDPSQPQMEDTQQGARTVSRFRREFLRDFAARLDRCLRPKS